MISLQSVTNSLETIQTATFPLIQDTIVLSSLSCPPELCTQRPLPITSLTIDDCWLTSMLLQVTDDADTDNERPCQEKKTKKKKKSSHGSKRSISNNLPPSSPPNTSLLTDLDKYWNFYTTLPENHATCQEISDLAFPELTTPSTNKATLNWSPADKAIYNNPLFLKGP